MITGGTSGIGLKCVERLSSDSNNTIILVGRSMDRLKAVSDTIGAAIIPIVYDLEDTDHVQEIFNAIEEQGLKLDGFVYSAGMSATYPVKSLRASDIKTVMNLNFISLVMMCRYFYSKRISNDEASIVAISSISSLSSDVGMTVYSASKAALNSSVRSISKEFARRRIRVNAILPAGVKTPMAARKADLLAGIHDRADNKTDNNPQPYGMIPAETVADLVSFLLSDQASYMTGELIPISAGRIY